MLRYIICILFYLNINIVYSSSVNIFPLGEKYPNDPDYMYSYDTWEYMNKWFRNNICDDTYCGNNPIKDICGRDICKINEKDNCNEGYSCQPCYYKYISINKSINYKVHATCISKE